ncbi:hypothetical protein RJ641_032475 [Dillenia turbinata]|uniref:Uncharacterized protein n=1 Tax=Dillenia turbinata TaxID=194707 RepID=A0AAN8W4E8_9MAGN
MDYLYQLRNMLTYQGDQEDLQLFMCKKAFLRNIAVNCSLTLLNISWIEVEFPMNVDDIFRPLGAWSAEFQGPKADVIQCFIVENHAFVSILHQLVH